MWHTKDMSNSSYVLRGLNADGVKFFYTGRAGAGWISSDASEAFVYASIEGARRRAVSFNRASEIHGVWFIAVTREVL